MTAALLRRGSVNSRDIKFEIEAALVVYAVSVQIRQITIYSTVDGLTIYCTVVDDLAFLDRSSRS